MDKDKSQKILTDLDSTLVVEGLDFAQVEKVTVAPSVGVIKIDS